MLAFFSLTLFVSATLLFFVQPMIGKMILPRLGGTPAVWNTCMVFFQAMLLIGYAYTHTLSTWQSRRRQLLIQSVLLLLPLVVLPFALGDWSPPTDENPVFALLWLLLGIVGLPFFVVSTSAPLLQKWFASTGHSASQDPYFLYGASNLGSMLALILYPTLIEPLFPVETQAIVWTVGYGVLVALVWGCALLVLRTPEPIVADVGPVGAMPEPVLADPSTAITAKKRQARLVPGTPDRPQREAVAISRDPDAITHWRRLRWVALAAAPSSLMLGVTTYLTTDIAAVPFFWVVPLALYLLTFILVFARWPVVWTQDPHHVVLYLQPCFLLFLVLKMVAQVSVPTWVEFALHLFAFLFTTLLCHGELAKDRPTARHLTEFYLWMSVGGVVGGLFNALVAPVALPFGIIEYPLAMVVGCLLRPNLAVDATLIPGDSKVGRPTPLGYVLDGAIPLVLAAASFGLLYAGDWQTFTLGGLAFKRSYAMAVAVILILATAMRPVRFGLSVGLLFLVVTLYDRHYENRVFEGRGFFGLVRVRENVETHGHLAKTYRTMIHGGINHGRQIVDPPELRRIPVTYFHPSNGIGEIFHKLTWGGAPDPKAWPQENEEWLKHYQKTKNIFTPADARLPTVLAGLGTDPLAQLVALHSQPAFAVVGLGTGTLGVHAQPFQAVDFYEIDPMVKALSIPPSGNAEDLVFYYLDDALRRGANLRVILGDGRLKIKEAPERYYHAISLDAFSSDAIPVHLLTDEAVKVYLSKLADGGVLIFNATNRYVRIEGVLAAIAEANDLECLHCPDYSSEAIPDKYGADWVVLRRKDSPTGYGTGGPSLFQRLDQERWVPVEPLPGPIWTDSYSNLLRVMRW